MEPFWVSVSGIDGTGKTTIVRHLLERLPGSISFKSPYFDWVRDMIKISGGNAPQGDPHTDLLIFSAAVRLENYLLRQHINKKKTIVSQRSWIDHYPYRMTQGFSEREISRFLRPGDLHVPDIIFYLHTGFATAYSRIKDEGGDKYEEKGFLKRLEKNFEYVINSIEKGSFVTHSPMIIRVNSGVSISKMKKEVDSRLSLVLDRKSCGKP